MLSSSHAQPRFARDLEFFIKADPANVQATHDALAEFWGSTRRHSPHTPTRHLLPGAYCQLLAAYCFALSAFWASVGTSAGEHGGLP